MFRKQSHLFLTTLLILLISFFTTTNTANFKLSSHLPENMLSGNTITKYSSLPLDLFEKLYNRYVKIFNDLSLQYALLYTQPWTVQSCNKLLEYIAETNAHWNTFENQVLLMGISLSHSRVFSLITKFAMLEGNMLRAYTKYCHNKKPSIDDLNNPILDIGLDWYNLHEQQNWEDLGITPPNTGQRSFDPQGCFPEPTTMVPQSTVLTPGPAFDPVGVPEHQIYLAFGMVGLAVFTATAGWIITTKVLGCSASSWWGTSAIRIPAYLTESAVKTIAPTITQKIAAGFSPLVIVDQLSTATAAKNPNFKPGDPLTTLNPLVDVEATAALQSLTGNANPWNQVARTKYLNDCKGEVPLCPKTPSGSGGSLTPSPTITPTGTADPCDPKYMARTVTATSTGFKKPTTGPTLGQYNDVLKLYLDIPADYQGFNPFDPNTGLFDLQGTGLQSWTVMGPDGTTFFMPYLESPFTPLEYAFDLTDVCRQYPGQTIYWALQFRFKTSTTSCNEVYMTYFGSYNCGTTKTGPVGPGPVYTPGGQTPPDIATTLTGIVQSNIPIATTPSGGGNPVGGTPIISGPATGGKCSGGLCPTAGGTLVCQAGEFCNTQCACAPLVCTPNGILEPSEECDPNMTPTSCPVNYLCNGNCKCQPTTATGGDTGALTGSAVQSSSTASASGGILTYEQSIISSTDPTTNRVTLQYTNNLGETAQGIFMQKPFAPLTISYTDGTTSTYTYVNNQLQRIVNTGGSTKTFTYDSQTNELITIATTEPNNMYYTTTFQYKPTLSYTVVDAFTTFPSEQLFQQNPYHLGTSLRENGQLPTSSQFLPYTTLIIERRIDTTQTYEELKIIHDPNSAGQGYTHIQKTFLSTNGDIAQIDSILDTNGDGLPEQTTTYIYTYDVYNRISAITTDTGRTYTFNYDSNANELTSLLSVTDNEGDNVAVQKNYLVDL